MKSTFLFPVMVALLGSFVALNDTLALNAPAATTEASTAEVVIQWRNTQHNFGEIVQSVPVTATFTFKNRGAVPVMLTQVQGSCGCTATAYPREPIQPGQSAAITATYNALNLGSFNKTVTVTTNVGSDAQVLTLQGTVVAAR